MKLYTIKEIAKLAGVSAGTVDRVLHNRGKVSPDKEEKVKKVLERIDYRPNPVARSLKLNKRFRLAVLMPDDDLDEYWKPCFEGVNELESDLLEKGIFVEVLKYAPDDPEDFRRQCVASLDLNPDGVVLGALFMHESKEFLDQLVVRDIPFNLFNTYIEGAAYTSFVGQDLVQSGRTAAHLFESYLPKPKSLLVLHMEEEFENAFHMQQKEKGFRAFFIEKNEDVEIHTINIKTESISSAAEEIRQLSATGLKGIFVTTSKAHLIVDIVDDVPIIGYDLIQENVRNLRTGKIKFLIYQNPRSQAHQGLSLLSDFLLKDIAPPKRRLLPIEIISSENILSYQY